MGQAEELAALRSQVRELSDREAIRELTAEYMQAMHDARWEDALACFAEGATYDHGVLGELRSAEDLRQFYLEFMPSFERAGGWAFDVLADPVIRVQGDRAEGRWFLLTLLVDPDTREAAWSMATLEYEYARIGGRWRFLHNRCIHEHLLAPYARGWGASGGSRVPSAAAGAPDPHFERLRGQGGKQRPGRLSRSIRGWTVPTLEP
jgi:hypothetical protein